SDKEPLYEYVRGLEKNAEDIEAGRLFYVAATRAKHRLHLLACGKCDEAGTPKPPNKRSLLHKGWFEAAGKFPAVAQYSTAATNEHVVPPQTLRRLRPHGRHRPKAAPKRSRSSFPGPAKPRATWAASCTAGCR